MLCFVRLYSLYVNIQVPSLVFGFMLERDDVKISRLQFNTTLFLLCRCLQDL